MMRSRLQFPAFARWKLDQTQTAMLGGIVLLTLVVYVRCLENGFVNDELWEIVENRYLAQWSFLWKSMIRDVWWFSDPHQLPQSAYYRPIQNVWLALNFHLFGRHPVGWHVLKVLLHLWAVLLVFRVAQLLSRSTEVALLSALLFALSPVNTESVVWSVGPPQAAVFELAAFCLFIERPKGHWRGLVWPVVLFSAAVFSHESAVIFPVLIAAYVFLFEAGNDGIMSASQAESTPLLSRIRTAVARSTPFFGVSVLYMVARVLVLGARGIPGFERTLVTFVGANGRLTLETTAIGHSRTQFLMTLPSVLANYLALFIFPWLAGPAHDVRFVTTPGMSNFYFPSTLLVLVVFVGYLGVRNSSRAPLYLFCAVWWLVTLAPALHVNFRLESTLFYFHDRFEYLSSFAFSLLLADLAVQIAHTSVLRRRVVGAASMALVVLYVGSVWRAEHIWHDDLTLFRTCVEIVPDSSAFRNHLAMALFRQQEPEAAVRLLLRNEIPPAAP
jgi:hypothetical protein